MRYEINIFPYIESVVEKRDGQLQLTVGCLDDMVGWCWYDGEKAPQAFMIRIIHSRLYDKYRREWEKVGLTFEDFKSLLTTFENDSQKDTLLYVVSGDNRTWHFGEDFRAEDEDIEYDFRSELQEMGFTSDQVKEIMEKFWIEFCPDASNWNKIPREDKERWLEWYLDTIKESENWEDLNEGLIDLTNEIKTEVLSMYRTEARKTFEKVVKEFFKGQPAH